MDRDALGRCLGSFHVAFGNYYIRHAEFGGFGYASADMGHGAYLAGEADFSGHAETSADSHVDIAREYGAYNGKIECGVVDLQSAGDVKEHVLAVELEAYALFENGKEHVETAAVEAGHGALRCAVGRGAYESLYLDQERAVALDGDTDRERSSSLCDNSISDGLDTSRSPRRPIS